MFKNINNINYSEVSGLYTPELTNDANITATISGECQWMRQGSVVTVSGKIQIDPILANVMTSVGISLPIASNFTSENQAAGTWYAPVIAGQGAGIKADAAKNSAQLNTLPTDTANQSWFFSFTYSIR